jgi:hypothetical protein
VLIEGEKEGGREENAGGKKKISERVKEKKDNKKTEGK